MTPSIRGNPESEQIIEEVINCNIGIDLITIINYELLILNIIFLIISATFQAKFDEG
jgi:hypothetical protein